MRRLGGRKDWDQWLDDHACVGVGTEDMTEYGPSKHECSAI